MAVVLIALALLLWLLIRNPLIVVMVPVSLIVLWEFGTVGLGILWAILLVVAVAREPARTKDTARR